MLHTDTFTLLSHQSYEDWQPIAIIPLPTKSNIKDRIVNMFVEWKYDENEESNRHLYIRQIDAIVDDLYNEGYYEDDVDKFKIEQVPFFE